jgi:hypothetical protein
VRLSLVLELGVVFWAEERLSFLILLSTDFEFASVFKFVSSGSSFSSTSSPESEDVSLDWFSAVVELRWFISPQTRFNGSGL